MAEAMLVNLFGPVLGLVVLWLLPTMNRRTLPFGIRVPAAHADAPVIATQLRTTRRWILGAGLVVVAAAVALTYLLPLPAAQASRWSPWSRCGCRRSCGHAGRSAR